MIFVILMKHIFSHDNLIKHTTGLTLDLTKMLQSSFPGSCYLHYFHFSVSCFSLDPKIEALHQGTTDKSKCVMSHILKTL